VLVLGAEGSGLRQLTRQNCDFIVRLPSLGAVESLNVSVAAGMLLYEAVRQRSMPPAVSRGPKLDP
jgi:23S rRNA (guanosine2251-2'-O)-methyltransferase